MKHSYYIDAQGVKHAIAKIVRTFSDSSIVDLPNFTGKNPCIVVYSDPTDGFWYNYLDGVTVSDRYYDEQGNLINFDDGTAFLAVTSLNNTSSGGNKGNHIEKANLLSSGKMYALTGSSILNHSDGLYADNPNSYQTKGNTWNGSVDWDKKGANEYYGTGLMVLNGSEQSIRFSTTRLSSDYDYNVWATTTTIIPQTPEPKTEIHYHYNVYFKLP